jgi:hypothetical protein
MRRELVYFLGAGVADLHVRQKVGTMRCHGNLPDDRPGACTRAATSELQPTSATDI